MSRAGRLIVITGPPGAGKSTVCRALVDELDRSVLVPGDDFFAFLNRRTSIAPWLPEAQEQNDVVLRAAAAAVGQYVSGGYDVVYDGVLGPWSLPGFCAATGLSGLHYAILLPSQERCLERVASRVGHGFTDPDATVHMHHQFADARIHPRHLLTDPPDTTEATVQLLLETLATQGLVYRPPAH